MYVSEEKWNKAKTFLQELESLLLINERAEIPFKFLEKGRGFMVYFCRTYSSFVPYLKGTHLSLDSWRDNRDAEGWKSKRKKEHTEVLDQDFNEEEFWDKESWSETISL